MAISKSQQKAVAKYNAANYDRIEVKVEKGRKELLIAHAERMGDSSLNKFVNRAISETIARDKEANANA